MPHPRGVAQPGSALALGARCREFKSLHPDQNLRQPAPRRLAVCLTRARSSNWIEHQPSKLGVVGSTPAGRASFLSLLLPNDQRKIDKKLARPAGVEPTTPSLEGWCSIQFELRARAKTQCGRLGGGQKIWSGWRDLNSRHLAPKASALPGCATPRGCRILRLRPWRGQR